MTWALLMEIYGQYGMKFEEANTELIRAITDASAPEGSEARAKAREPDNDQSMVLLQAMMGDSDFGGPRG